MGIRDRVSALLGVSAFRAPTIERVVSPPDDVVEKIREAHGGQLAPIPTSQTRWYLRDLESAEYAADTGDISFAARLMRAAGKDGVYSGVLSTRTGGLVRLPKRFRGDEKIVSRLQKDSEETRGVFDEMFPATELALLAADGLELGVGVGELVPVIGREFPVFVRLDPEFLWYQWSENQWYYRSIAGMLPIIPGDGRWVLHMPGGRVSPWQHGIWRAVGRAYIRKEHAASYKDSWEAKLANPARVAVSPQGASEPQKQSWFNSVMAWGVNTVFGLTPGYDVKLLESNGRGYESFQATISEQNNEFVIVVAGQTVTTDGGAGFQNSDVHKSIRADLIKETADGLAHTINTQGLPQYVIDTFGEDALSPGVTIEWDVTPPKDRNSEAAALQTTAQAIKQLTEALNEHGLCVDVRALATQFGIPLDMCEVETADGEPSASGTVPSLSIAAMLDIAQSRGLQLDEASVTAIASRLGIGLEKIPAGETPKTKIELAPTDVAKIVLASEGRASQGLPPFGDERDGKTITQLGEGAEAQAEAEGEIEVAETESNIDEDETEGAAVA